VVEVSEGTVRQEATTPLSVSYFVRENLYGGACVCGTKVAPKAGFVQKDRDTQKWQTLCRPCVEKHGRFVPDGVYGKSVVANDQPAMLGRCTGCHAHVALVKSKRTGKWYLANTARSYNEDSAARRVYPFRPHQCPTPEDYSAIEVPAGPVTDEEFAALPVLDLGEFLSEADESRQGLNEHLERKSRYAPIVDGKVYTREDDIEAAEKSVREAEARISSGDHSEAAFDQRDEARKWLHKATHENFLPTRNEVEA
jgi:hypothetical protein